MSSKHAPEAIKTLADITKNGTPGARVSAAVALLDRAYGKAPTFSTTDPGTFKRAIDMTDDELAAIACRCKAYRSKTRYLVPYPSVSICLQ